MIIRRVRLAKVKHFWIAQGEKSCWHLVSNKVLQKLISLGNVVDSRAISGGKCEVVVHCGAQPLCLVYLVKEKTVITVISLFQHH